MAYNTIGGFPSQRLSFSRKNKSWRKKCVDFGDDHSLIHYNLARKTSEAMTINYDLMRGKLHMSELKLLVNPFGIDASFIPDNIQHYPIINSKIEVLKGEESKRLFDFKAVVTNPNAVSEMEEEKNKLVNEQLQQLIMDSSQSEEDFQKELEKQSYYFQYEYQDKREVRANLVLNHYMKELEMSQAFNKGFDDVTTVGEELYQCDIVGGEPYVEKLDPREVLVISSGNSSRIEDADMIIIDQYWSKGRIKDAYYDQLTKKDLDYLDNITLGAGQGHRSYADEMDNIRPFRSIVPIPNEWTAGENINPFELFTEHYNKEGLPFDANGNIRVLRVYWKSDRKIKKVKSYDPETGEEQFNFYPENYIIDPDKGEEEEIFWINEAWEGTKIGDEIYVNMRPRPVQYNRLSNPSKCHFGIIGQIYSTNGDSPFSLVDIMKPYAYLYDVIQDRLNKTLARNHGKVIELDFAKTPKGWDSDKWLYYLSTHGIAIKDSFNEGEVGRATGVMAGQMNNASSGVIDASLGNEITQYINLLEWISNKTGELAGISKQREGQISNRETVGGVERATLQSSHSTEWLFFPHESVKKRVLECFLETAKIAFKGRKVKFNYILSDGSMQLVEFEGDEFAECDYGIVVDNSNGAQELNQKLDMLAQAGLQNGMSFSTVMKLYTTTSLAEKQRTVEQDEKRRQEQAQQQQQQEYQLQQQQMQLNAETARQQQELEYKMHQEDNETKILVAQINSKAEADRLALMNHDNAEANEFTKQELEEKKRQFDAKMKQDAAKLDLDKQKHKDDVMLKEKQISNSKNKK